MTYTREQILDKVKSIMVELFELKAENIKLESRFNEDLGLDSIDAIDLITHLQSFVGQRLLPEDFRSVRTIADIIQVAEVTLNQTKTSASSVNHVKQDN